MTQSAKRRRRRPLLAAARAAGKDLLSWEAEVTFMAAAADGGEGAAKPGPRRFEVLAYTGGALEVAQYPLPVVVDLAGIKASKSLKANLDHDTSHRVGHVTELVNDGRALRMVGLASAASAARDEVVASADEGYQWQASIEGRPTKMQSIPRGKRVTVNGQSFTGPLLVAREFFLRGFAFAASGADDDTTARIAASAGGAGHDQGAGATMKAEFKTWLAAKGFDAGELSAEQHASLEAMFDGERAGAGPQPSDLGSVLDRAKQNRDRLAKIADITAAALADHPRHIEQIEAMARVAEGGDWTPERYELELLRATRPQLSDFRPRSGREELDGRVLEAALCLAGNLDGVEEQYDARTLEAADKQYRHGLGLAEFLETAARRNGFRDSRSDLRGLLKAAFADVKADGVFSTVSVPGILSNVGNKFEAKGFDSVDMAWRGIATTRPVRNFQQITSYSLTGAMQYKKVGPAGELQHVGVGEIEYTNRAETYGALFAITRQDIINDDLGAFTRAGFRLGRGGALKLNDVFWSTFLDRRALIPTNNSNLNYFAGATTNLQASSLRTAFGMLKKQIDADGKPLGVTPKILLVPSELGVLADELMTSTQVNTGGAATNERVPNRNTWAGKFRVVETPYLSNTSYTGSSLTAWYLLADPLDLSFIEVCFLNGRESPVIESADVDFAHLGVQMRGYHDFGVSLQEYRAIVESAGA